MSPFAEIAALFLKLGFTAFGGPAAQIATISLILHLGYKINSTWLIAGGAIASRMASFVH